MTLAGWYSDPANPVGLRYWDGAAWTQHVAPMPPPSAADAAAVVRPAVATTAYAPAQPVDDPSACAYAAAAAHRGAAYATPYDVAPPGPVRSRGRIVIPAPSIAAGLAPTVCAPHHRSGRTQRISFQSRTPGWVWVTLLIGVLWALIIAAVLRKTVVAPAWPVCDQCRKERRQNLLGVWLSLAAWIPAFAIAAYVPTNSPDAVLIVVWIVAIMGPLVSAVWFGERASLVRRIGAEVSSDGFTVSFPAHVFDAAPEPAYAGGAHQPELPAVTPDPRFGTRV